MISYFEVKSLNDTSSEIVTSYVVISTELDAIIIPIVVAINDIIKNVAHNTIGLSESPLIYPIIPIRTFREKDKSLLKRRVKSLSVIRNILAIISNWILNKNIDI